MEESHLNLLKLDTLLNIFVRNVNLFLGLA